MLDPIACLHFASVGSEIMAASKGHVDQIIALAASRGLELRPESAVADDNGWDFRVVHATDSTGKAWILRAPRRPEIARAAAAEGRLLAILHGRFDVEVPHWRFADDELIAYPRLPGEPVAWEDAETHELHWKFDRRHPPAHYIDAVGEFMATLHGTPLAEVESTAIPVRAPAAARAELAEHVAFAVTDLGMHSTWRDRGARWLDRDDLWPDSPVLIHGDLHPGHQLVDSDGALLGVLDWTDAEIGYAAKEFVEAARKFEPPVLDALIESYERHGGVAGPALRAHAVESIAFAPLNLGILGLESRNTRYIDAARRYFQTATDR